MIARESAREAYLKRQSEAKSEPVKGKASIDDEEASEYVGMQDNDESGAITKEEGNFAGDIDDLSDSEYVPKPSKSKFRLQYKGKIYQSGKSKAESGLDVPIGVFRCTLQNNKCSGKIETIKNFNGRVHIKERNAHTCE